jgi:hypothetical protein
MDELVNSSLTDLYQEHYTNCNEKENIHAAEATLKNVENQPNEEPVLVEHQLLKDSVSHQEKELKSLRLTIGIDPKIVAREKVSDNMSDTVLNSIEENRIVIEEAVCDVVSLKEAVNDRVSQKEAVSDNLVHKVAIGDNVGQQEDVGDRVALKEAVKYSVLQKEGVDSLKPQQVETNGEGLVAARLLGLGSNMDPRYGVGILGRLKPLPSDSPIE